MRMTRWQTLVLALAAACNSSQATPAAPPPPQAAKAAPQTPAKPKPPEAPIDKESQSLTRDLQKMNGDDFGKPSAKFNAGTVSARRAPAATKTKTGYEVKFGNGSAVSTPAVYKGKVYTSGGFNSREFYAFEATTGKQAFGLDLSDDGPSSSACEDGECVFNTESCTVFAVDAETGKRKWAWFLGDPQTSSPTIANGTVFTSYPAGGVDGRKPRPPNSTHVLAAFDLKTGKVLWQDWLDADVISAPVAVGEFLYVSTFNGTVIKFEQATGKIRYASKAHATSAPVVQFVAGLESMYYTRRADQMAAGQPAAPPNGHGTGKGAGPVATSPPAPADPSEQIVRTDHNEPVEKYSTPAKSAAYLDHKVQAHAAMKSKAMSSDADNGFAGGAPAAAAPESANGLVGQSNVATIQQFQGSRILHLSNANVNTMGDEVIATNPEDGKQLWSHKLDGDVAKEGGALASPPIAAGSHLIVATLHGTLLEIDPATGAVENKWDVGGTLRSQPVVADGWIYVGTDDGRLVAVNTGDPSLTGWSMWGGNAQRTGMQPDK
jgi:outer membrane protein assembly factor BamB